MKNAIITGSTSGIGRAFYHHFKDNPNWNVIGIAEKLSDYDVDLSKLKEHLYFDDDMQIDLLINCAGIFLMPEPILHKNVRKVMNVNFWGTYWMIRSILPFMLMEGGNIINIASVSGMGCEEDEPIYAASKAAVISLTKSYALNLAPNIRVNCISPGFYNTNLVKGDLPDHLLRTIPMEFEDEPEHLCSVVDMILKTPYLTGANIVVDGGLSL